MLSNVGVADLEVKHFILDNSLFLESGIVLRFVLPAPAITPLKLPLLLLIFLISLTSYKKKLDYPVRGMSNLYPK